MELQKALNLRKAKCNELNKKMVDEANKPIKAYNGDELAYKLTRRAVVNFFKKNPIPSDKQLYKWAKDKGFDPQDVKEIARRLTTKHVNI